VMGCESAHEELLYQNECTALDKRAVY